MFGTLHCNSPTKEAEFVERPYGSLNPGMNSACDRCRAYKVKCTVSGKSCSRCRRLKKTCSFTSVRQRSSQRVWKTDVNSKRQESQSSDRSAQPQTSPSPKDSGNEGEDHIKQRGSISSAHTDRNDGSEKGDPHIADYTSHQLSEASSSLSSSSSSSSSSSTTSTSSLPFLADYDQREMSEQRDDLCTCSILPFPFCSSSIHYNSPDAMVRSNIGTPQALPTPPASRDETPQQQQQQLLSNSQSHDPQFEMGPIDTESLDITALASSMYWSQGSFEKTCQCLADVIFALEKLEASCSSGSRAGLDSIVANQKEVIELCRCMLKCSNCMAKRENFILLVFMSERIVVACSRIVTMYRMEDGGLRNANNNNNNNNSNTHTHNHSGATTVAPSQLACLPGSHLSGTTTDMDMDTQCLAAAAAAAASAAAASSSSPSQPTTSGWQQLLLGDYKINSALEWDHLVRALINFQLRAVRALLGDVKSIGTMILGDAQKESLARAETIVNKLEQDIYII